MFTGLRVLVLAAVVGGLALVQEPPQQPRPVFRAGANVVRVDVTVTRKGEPAADLSREDFEVTEDGVPQAIESFQLVRADGQPVDDRSLEIRSAQHAAAEAARDEVRIFLIFWDEYHIGQHAPALRGRQALTEFVRTAFGPTDLVAIMDQLTPVDAVRFTRDRLALAEQVHALKGRLGVYVPARSAMEEGHLQYPSDVARLRNEVTMSALSSAAAFLGNFRDGRKALLFVSQGIPVYSPGAGSRPYDDIVRSANANNTAIYTLDPASEVGRRPPSLLSLAYDTGGRPFIGSNRPVELLPQMVRDLSAYYLLGYASPAPFDGKFHRIKVRVKKEGYEVRARSGYFTPTPADMARGRAEAAAAEARPSDIGRALAELETRSDRALDLWVGFAPGNAGATRVTVAWGPRKVAAGTTAAVAIKATPAGGGPAFERAATADREASFDAAPGPLKLAVTALDGRGNELDVDARTVPVPDFSARLTIATPVVLRTRTPRDLRAIAAGAAVPAEAGREFDRSDRLFVRFRIEGVVAESVSARLLNRQGAEVRQVSFSRRPDGAFEIDLPLNASPRGDYLLAIEARRQAESTRALVPIRVR